MSSTARFGSTRHGRNGLILYRRCNFSRNMIHCIDVRYPDEQERA